MKKVGQEIYFTRSYFFISAPSIEKVSSDARYVFIVLGTICAFVCTIAFFWIFHRRDSAVIQSASPKFLLLMIVGLFLEFLSVVIYSAHISSATCHIVVYIFTIGFTLLFGSLIAKSHRVWKIFALKNFKRVAYSDKRVIIIFSTSLETLIYVGACFCGSLTLRRCCPPYSFFYDRIAIYCISYRYN